MSFHLVVLNFDSAGTSTVRYAISQNPKNCSNAKKLVCPLEDICGLGCALHHVIVCFMGAYGTQRTMFVQSKVPCLHIGSTIEL